MSSTYFQLIGHVVHTSCHKCKKSFKENDRIHRVSSSSKAYHQSCWDRLLQ